jgi:N-acetylmuramoyl-L-alanine amidase
MLNPKKIVYLVVHCSDTPDDTPLTARDIHQMHIGFGWNGVGYHRIIRRDGMVEAARPDYWVGAHVKGFNDVSLGVCLIGRYEFSSVQMDSLEALLKKWKWNYPNAQICGHRDFEYTDKTCPNFDVAVWCRTRGI